MKKVVVFLYIFLSLVCSINVYGQPDRTKKIVTMLIPNPKAPETAENYNSSTTEAAYNLITSYLLEHNVSVIDKYYVDLALEEIKNKKDMDIDAASIEYGKKNMADRVIWFYVAEKSLSFDDKRFACTLKGMNVRTGQVKAVITEEGVHREDREKAAAIAAKAAIEKALPEIIRREDIYTITFFGNLNLSIQDKLDNMLSKIDGVTNFEGYLLAENKCEYTVWYLFNIQTIRQRINQLSKNIGFRLELIGGTSGSLSFSLYPMPNIHNRLRTIAGIGILASAAASGISAYMANDYYSQYKDAKIYSDMIKYKNSTQKWDNYTKGAAAGTAVAVLWYWFEAKHAVKMPKISKANIEWYAPKPDVYGLSLKYHF